MIVAVAMHRRRPTACGVVLRSRESDLLSAIPSEVPKNKRELGSTKGPVPSTDQPGAPLAATPPSQSAGGLIPESHVLPLGGHVAFFCASRRRKRMDALGQHSTVLSPATRLRLRGECPSR